MIEINLLPWRETRRRAKRQRLIASISIFWAVCVFVIGGLWWLSNKSIDLQIDRNRFLESKIGMSESTLREIDAIKEKRRVLLEYMHAVHQLQMKRSMVVKFMDELVRCTPIGVYLTLAEQIGSTLRLEGFAESNSRVAELMRNLDDSLIFGSSDLDIVDGGQVGKESFVYFDVVVTIEMLDSGSSNLSHVIHPSNNIVAIRQNVIRDSNS